MDLGRPMLPATYARGCDWRPVICASFSVLHRVGVTSADVGWQIDVRHNHGKQFRPRRIHLEVPARYGIYTGGRTFRADLPCFHEGQPDCPGCRRTAISMISAHQLTAMLAPTDTATTVFNESIPLEDLVDPRNPPATCEISTCRKSPRANCATSDSQAFEVFGCVRDPVRRRVGRNDRQRPLLP
ncbi:hypothetical protein EV645_0003 [Kribbella rubisoli]|uniref:Uncharacterized protein n=1 Tax=Kribbella rubisoli TaxID=3075929 RepID=A0A4Q7XLJ6_9ACTN|nr:hypothetical protein EV645_0003 [Kribbella rubisoli]